ncbi:hypothetical protein NDU88_007759 [Pleurodeles waltl]|uniref:Uncharacterized protein n=1 Tax=Pleurodeles waltl TaxID=8319 RepID=A0AAV7NX68_PLEWA|nr:hypothetical protein NDU88_007759 [Pleurodeles waltl]
MRVTGSNRIRCPASRAFTKRSRELGAQVAGGWWRKSSRGDLWHKPEPSTKSLLLRQPPQRSASRPKIGPGLVKMSKAPNGWTLPRSTPQQPGSPQLLCSPGQTSKLLAAESVITYLFGMGSNGGSIQ